MPAGYQYKFEGILRLSYGWDNPNHAAAVLICLLALVWALERIVAENAGARVWRPLVWVGELLVGLAVALTYSRGGALGCIAGLLAFAAIYSLALSPSAGRKTWWLRFLAPRIIGLGILLAATGLSRRFEQSAGDASVGNRLELWKGGLKLINASPYTGWGKGNSGLAYMQWVQSPVEDKLHYNGMVNSYLHFAAEYGLPAFALALAVVLIPIGCVVCQVGSASLARRSFLTAAAAGLVGFAVAAVFSTLWVYPAVMWAPAVLVLLIVISSGRHGWIRRLSGSLKIAVPAAALAAIALWGAARVAISGEPWRLQRSHDGSIAFIRNVASVDGAKSMTILPDGRTLGNYYGKEIRRALFSSDVNVDSFVVYPPSCIPRATSGKVIALGSRINDLYSREATGNIWSLFPASLPPAEGAIAGLRWVGLPAFDQVGYAATWRLWSSRLHCRCDTLPNSGQDARVRLKALVQDCLADRL